MEKEMLIVQLAGWLFRIYGLLILARVLMSWIPVESRRNPLVDFLVAVTEPVLGPCRDLVNAILSALGVDLRRMPIDFSPMLAYFIIDWLIRPAVMRVLILLFM